jgi:hypothetical protein
MKNTVIFVEAMSALSFSMSARQTEVGSKISHPLGTIQLKAEVACWEVQQRAATTESAVRRSHLSSDEPWRSPCEFCVEQKT